jgi:hypothetical protein
MNGTNPQLGGLRLVRVYVDREDARAATRVRFDSKRVASAEPEFDSEATRNSNGVHLDPVEVDAFQLRASLGVGAASRTFDRRFS